ncbi:hypothetical protein GOBAR_DD09078 [Gossypium barbadense]|nr:hypothetical protein GOBAR_DD09078 [Gossypium barbadense]
MPTRSVKIMQLQHPDTTSYGSSGAGYSSSWFSRLREKMKEMTFFNWVEMFLPCCRWIRTYKWREYLQVDLMAGTTVGIMLVPQVIPLLSAFLWLVCKCKCKKKGRKTQLLCVC